MSRPRGWRRTASEYEKHGEEELLDKNESAARFSHEVGKVKKLPYQHQIPKESHDKLWFKKLVKNSAVAQREVYAQELFRVFIPNHPKTRMAVDENGNSYVLSQGVPEYISFDDFVTVLNEIGDGYEILNQHFLDDDDRPEGTPRFKGLGDVMVMSLLMNEIDLKPGNMGIDANDQIVKIDGDLCFARLREDDGYYDITSGMIDDIFYPGYYSAYNWLDVMIEDKINPYPKLIGNGKMQAFRQEVNAALLRAILMPDELFGRMADHHMELDLAMECSDEVIARRNQMREAALTNKNFQAFIHTNNAWQVKDEFEKYLVDFRITSKEYLVERGKEEEMHRFINDEFQNIINELLQNNLQLSSQKSKSTSDLKRSEFDMTLFGMLTTRSEPDLTKTHVQLTTPEEMVLKLFLFFNKHAEHYQSIEKNELKIINQYIEALNNTEMTEKEIMEKISQIALDAITQNSISGENPEVIALHASLRHLANPEKQHNIIKFIETVDLQLTEGQSYGKKP